MDTEIGMLVAAAISVSFLHTLTGPDHYVPFIALSKTRGWSVPKTIMWTVVCGIGHVGSSVVLGLVGAALGWSLARMGWFEEVRGGVAGWAMLAFGVVYTIWGIRQVYQNKRHKHFDVYDDGSMYVYEHRHGEVVLPQDRKKVTPWVMFLIFLLGPCEPLIPMMAFPAAQSSTLGLVVLVSVFTLFTLLTMVAMVLLGYYGFSFFKTNKLEKYIHPIGGATILVCAAGMVFLGW